MVSPPLKPDMGLVQGTRRRAPPGEVAMCSVGPQNDDRASVAVAVTAGLALPGIAHVVAPDRTHEIELRPADIDVGTILN